MSASERPNIIGFRQNADFFYRNALRALDSGDRPGAVMNARTAARMDPGNVEYELLLASVLCDVRKTDESIRILFGLLEGECGVDADCFFLLGRNFFNSLDYVKAERCFTEYTVLAPNGGRAREAEEYLEFIVPLLYASVFEENAPEQKAIAMSAQARIYLETGRFEKAVRMLESMPANLPREPEDVNNLALAYFYTGRREKAVELSKKVLEASESNVHATCNMAVFMRDAGDTAESEKYARRLPFLVPEGREEAFKIGATLCELGEHERAYAYLNGFNNSLEYDPDVQSLFCEAAAAYNTRRFREAAAVLTEIRKIEATPVVADYFLRLAKAALEDETAFETIPYAYALPAEEARERMSRLNSFLRLDEEQLQAAWRGDRSFQEELLWALDSADEDAQIVLGALIAGFADVRAEEILREFLLRRRQPDSVKHEIFSLLAGIGAPEPYFAYLEGDIAEVRRNGVPDETNAGQEERSLYALIRAAATQFKREDLLPDALELASRVLASAEGDILEQSQREMALAAVWVVSDASGRAFDLAAACERFRAKEKQTRLGVNFLIDF